MDDDPELSTVLRSQEGKHILMLRLLQTNGREVIDSNEASPGAPVAQNKGFENAVEMAGEEQFH